MSEWNTFNEKMKLRELQAKYDLATREMDMQISRIIFAICAKHKLEVSDAGVFAALKEALL